MRPAEGPWGVGRPAERRVRRRKRLARPDPWFANMPAGAVARPRRTGRHPPRRSVLGSGTWVSRVLTGESPSDWHSGRHLVVRAVVAEVLGEHPEVDLPLRVELIIVELIIAQSVEPGLGPGEREGESRGRLHGLAGTVQRAKQVCAVGAPIPQLLRVAPRSPRHEPHPSQEVEPSRQTRVVQGSPSAAFWFAGRSTELK